jgi:serine beta-lactamase-like protein LACTB
MLKKIFKILALALFIIVIAASIYLFSKIGHRPEQHPNAHSFTVDENYHAASLKAEAWLTSLYAQNQLPSLSAAVSRDGKLVWVGTIGYTDLINKIQADNNSLYRIGSISKSLSAVAAMRMNEKGLIDINQPVNHYLKNFGAGNASYTLKQLLSHQAGIRHYNKTFSDNFNTKEYSNTRAAAAIVENDPLLFSSGSAFHYSTYGYTLASLAMETAYKLPFEHIVNEEVISPAKMTSTHPHKIQQTHDKNITQPYWLISNILFEAPEENVSHKYAGGGYVSTPSDLVKFGAALTSNELITPESRNLLWSPVLLANGIVNKEHYALGFRMGEDEFGKFAHHGGTANGGYSFLLIYPDTVVAFSANYSPENFGFDRLKAAKDLANVFR